VDLLPEKNKKYYTPIFATQTYYCYDCLMGQSSSQLKIKMPGYSLLCNSTMTLEFPSILTPLRGTTLLFLMKMKHYNPYSKISKPVLVMPLLPPSPEILLF
jgi:hypothetical protein